MPKHTKFEEGCARRKNRDFLVKFFQKRFQVFGPVSFLNLACGAEKLVKMGALD